MHEIDLSRSQYLKLKNFLDRHLGQKIFPSYKKISSAKNKCYPDPDSCQFTESKYQVNPKMLIKHTVERIMTKKSAEQSIACYTEKCLDFKLKYGI